MQRILAPTANRLSVSWKWFNEAQGLVEWTFNNFGTSTSSGILLRDGYTFGSAFYPIYYFNSSAFGTTFLAGSPTPLKDNGVESDSPPLAVIEYPTAFGSYNKLVSFVFTLAPNQSWSMLEGGFSANFTPAAYGNISFISVKFNGVDDFCIDYNTAVQCQQFNTQAGTSYPCPPNPFSVKSAVFTCYTQLPNLFPDGISTGTCNNTNCQMLIDKIEYELAAGQIPSVAEILEYIKCIFG